MNLLFLTLVNITDLSSPGIYQDLLREFSKHGQNVYVVTASERRNGTETRLIKQEYGTILSVKTGNIQKTNLIEKGLSTVALEGQYIAAIKKYLSNVKFDLVMYSTPPVTLAKAVEFVKKRDGATTYLLLKDIFPQNSVDLGMLSKAGPKAAIYKFFKAKEKKLYALSDRIGCMSPANVKYLLAKNPELKEKKVEVCPNAEEPRPISLTEGERRVTLDKYGIPADRKVFIYGGNLGRPQCVPFIVECFKKTTECFFVIAGAGTDRHILEDYIRSDNPGHVKLLPSIPKTDFEKLVAACNVGLIFLDYRFEIPNYPSRLLTYMQAGLPVLCCTDTATDVGTIATENSYGWTCPSNDSDAFAMLAAEINDLSEEDLKVKGKAGQEFFNKEYTAEKAYKIITNE